MIIPSRTGGVQRARAGRWAKTAALALGAAALVFTARLVMTGRLARLGGEVGETAVFLAPSQPRHAGPLARGAAQEGSMANRPSLPEGRGDESSSSSVEKQVLPLVPRESVSVGQERRDTSDLPELGLELIRVPPGTFAMGSVETEHGRRTNEGPQRRITITYEFQMSKCEITVGQYNVVLGRPNRRNRGRPMNVPVVDVSWPEATNFCYLLTERESKRGRLPEGVEFRLPTEAEWEHACRAGTTSRFSFGDDPQYSSLSGYAWFATPGTSPHPVASKLPNPWGLYDMHGNASEWCLDWLGADLSTVAALDPFGGSASPYRAVRGGSWMDGGGECRAAFRQPLWATGPVGNVGFRVVLAPPPWSQGSSTGRPGP